MRSLIKDRIIEMTHLEGKYRDGSRYRPLVEMMWSITQSLHPEHQQPRFPYKSKVLDAEQGTDYFYHYRWDMLTDEQYLDLYLITVARFYAQR